MIDKVGVFQQAPVAQQFCSTGASAMLCQSGTFDAIHVWLCH